MKPIFLIAILLICIVVSSLPIEANDTHVINVSAFDKKQRPDAVFDHDRHMEIIGEDNCTVCHHFYENDTLIPDESSEGMFCSDCHRPGIQSGKTHLTRAFHNRCKGCHLNRKAGPVLCAGCHVNN